MRRRLACPACLQRGAPPPFDSVFLRHILEEINFLEESSSCIEFSDLMRNREKQRASVDQLYGIIKIQNKQWLDEIIDSPDLEPI
jgi:hypothetical protein